jgi:3-oxoacyl-[acyl-carrier protein] reductase
LSSKAWTARKSRSAAPVTVPGFQVAPPSVVITNVPFVPVAHTIFVLTTLTPRREAVVLLVWGVHCCALINHNWHAKRVKRALCILIQRYNERMLAGKTALVTGANGHIGTEISRALGREGAHVIVNYFEDREGAELLASAIAGTAIYADIGNASDVDKMIAEFSRIDILVNNTGIQKFCPLLDILEDDWDRVVRTNLKGCFLCTQRVGRVMKRNGGGRIINIGSGSNKAPFPGLASYTATKGAIEMFTKVAAAELGAYGITVNCVAPGAIETERTKLETPDYAGTWAKLTPLGRVGTPEDVARAILFFASDAAEFISGQTLWVDGGLFSKPAWPY